MTRYILGRLLSAVIVLFVLSVFVFSMVRLIPGDPVANFVDPTTATPERIAEVRAQLGLDRPWLEQYLGWIGGLLTGNMGTSMAQPVAIASQLALRLPVTLELALIASVFSVCLGFGLGLLAAIWRGRWPDVTIRLVSFVLIATPVFVVATIVVLWNSTGPRLPLLSYRGWDQGLIAHLSSLLVPAMIVGLPMGAVLARYVRNSLLDTLSQDFVRTARAKGASTSRIVARHALRNAMIPVVTVIGAQLAILIGGTIVIENVFVLPGVGSALITAINTSDYPMVQTFIIVLGAVYIAINLLVDLTYPIVDPRVRLVTS